MLSERVLTQLRSLVAFMKAMNLLHRAMHSVLYRCIAMSIKMAVEVGTFCVVIFVDCLPGDKRGDTEQVVA